MIGLSVNLGTSDTKSEVIPTAGEHSVAQPSLFQGYLWNTSRCFSLLGAPINNAAFRAEHTDGRRKKGRALLDRLTVLEDPKTAYPLERCCASFCRLGYSARVVPPGLHKTALRKFDGQTRQAFTAVTGIILDDAARERAQWSIGVGGVGPRSAERHADAAYVSSLVSIAPLASQIDPAFRLLDDEEGSHTQGATVAQQKVVCGEQGVGPDQRSHSAT